ncbi:MAG: TonB-dependent receptor [Bacteroidia bacterium]|nr:TonB-dependent receptor [Bacteroidia bacterium]
MLQSRLSLLLVCFILIVTNTFANTVPPKRFGITILVVDSLSKQPLEAASIRIVQLNKNTTTNADGVVNIDSVAKGWYTIQCAYIGYYNQQQLVEVNANKKIVFELCKLSTHLHEIEIKSHSDEINPYSLNTKAKLDAEFIERNRGNAAADLLKNISGVSLLSTGAAISKPVIRGLHSNRLVTINNGIRQEGQQWGADHGAEIDPFSSSKIEVIKGASSVEFGAEAIGGVVKFSEREFRHDKGIDGELMLNAFSNNGLAASSLFLQGSHGNKHKFSWRTQGTMRKAGDSRAPNYTLSNTGYDELSGNYALHYQFKNLHVEVSQSYYQTNIGILRAAHVGNSTDLLVAIASGKPTYIAPFTYDIQNPKQEVAHQTSAFKFSYDFNSGAKLQLQYSLQLNDRKEFDRAPRWATSQQTNPKPQYYLQLNSQIFDLKYEHHKFKNTKGVWGINWMKQDNVSEGVLPIIPNFSANTLGIYLIEKWQKKKWLIETGVRYDIRNQTRYVLINNVVDQEYKYYSSATISSGLAYWITEKLKVQGNFSSAWRAPSINELYSNGLHGGTATYETGNPNLLPERSYNTEVSAILLLNKWNIELNMYRNYIDNFIYKQPINTPIVTIRGAFPQFLFVQQNALLQGIDATVKNNINKNLSFNIIGSYLHATQVKTNLPLIYMPANRAAFELNYQQPKLFKLLNFYAQSRISYVAKQNRFEVGVDYVDPPSAYGLIDLNLGFEQHIKKQTIKWSFGVNNLLNTGYRDYLSRYRYFAMEPGRNFIIRLSIPFNILTTTHNY